MTFLSESSSLRQEILSTGAGRGRRTMIVWEVGGREVSERISGQE